MKREHLPTLQGGLMLTDRERICLQMRAMGYITKQIAAELNMSPRTVETHYATALRRNKCKSPFQLIALFVLATQG